MVSLIPILLATFLVSLISLIGIFTVGINPKVFNKLLFLLVGFSAGGMIGGAFLHLLPEAVEKMPGAQTFTYAIIGFTIFFSIERYFHWRHCHDDVCEVHSFTYLNLIGDSLHNFTDGLIIAAAFLTDYKLGVVTTLAVLFHEIPQEVGDFGVLIYGGFSRKKALWFNFLSACAALLGASLGYWLFHLVNNVSAFLIAFTAGGFIYIAASDLIPELHKQKNAARANFAFFAFILGVLFMALLKFIGV